MQILYSLSLSLATKTWNYSLLQHTGPLFLSLPSICRIMPHHGILKTISMNNNKDNKNHHHNNIKDNKYLLEIYNSDTCYYSRLIREFCDSNEVSSMIYYRFALYTIYAIDIL